MMGTLKLAGMRHAYDEVVADAVKRQHSAQRVVGDLLKAEIDEKQARSIKYQMTIAKLPLAKEIAAFDFAATPINDGLVKDLATGAFLAAQRNAVLVGGTGTLNSLADSNRADQFRASIELCITLHSQKGTPMSVRNVIGRLFGYPYLSVRYRPHFRIALAVHPLILKLIEDNEDGVTSGLTGTKESI